LLWSKATAAVLKKPIAEDIENWGKLVKLSGIKAE
jgi:hypothetical protein